MSSSSSDTVSLSSFEQVAASLGSSDQDRELRLRALSTATFPDLPIRNTEAWRKIDLSGLDLQAFDHSGSRSDLDHDAPSDAKTVQTLADGFAERRLEQKEQDHVFNRMGIAFSSHDLSVELNGQPTQPVTVRHALKSGGNALHHRLSILARAGAEVTIIEEFESSGDAPAAPDPSLWNTLVDLDIEANARVNYVLLRNLGDNEYHFHDFRARLGRDSRLFVFVMQLGGLRGKSFYHVDLEGSGAYYRGTGIAAGVKREYNEIEMHATHSAPDSESSLLYKAVVADRAHNVFNGNLHIAPGVRNVSSHQVNNNLLLNPRARAESMPNLVIQAEQVQCEHGATVGELEEEGLFYLMSRGIPEPEARKLLIEGFISDVVREIPIAEKQPQINLAVKERLNL